MLVSKISSALGKLESNLAISGGVLAVSRVVGCGYWSQNTWTTLSASLVRIFAQLGALRLVCDGAEMAHPKAQEMPPHTQVVCEGENRIWKR